MAPHQQQHTATPKIMQHCNTRQHFLRVSTLAPHHTLAPHQRQMGTLQHAATRCNTLQHAATHCKPLQHTVPYYNTFENVYLGASTLRSSPFFPAMQRLLIWHAPRARMGTRKF